MTTFNAQEDKARARLAYCLTQWRRPHGGNIPQSEEGIAEHQRLVADYEAIYGPAKPNSLKQYASVYANIRIGLEADRESDAIAEKFRRDVIARKEQAAADARIREQALIADQNRREAERVLSMNGDLIPLLEMQVERLSRYVTRDTEREAELRGMLDSERFKDSPLRGEIRGNLEDVQERLAKYRGRLAKFREDVADAESENDWARGVLGTEPTEEELVARGMEVVQSVIDKYPSPVTPEPAPGVVLEPDIPIIEPQAAASSAPPDATEGIQWKRNGKFLNATEGLHPDINRLVIIDDGDGKYRGRAFVQQGLATTWRDDFSDVQWKSIGDFSDGWRYDATLTPEQYESIKSTGAC